MNHYRECNRRTCGTCEAIEHWISTGQKDPLLLGHQALDEPEARPATPSRFWSDPTVRDMTAWTRGGGR